MAATANDVDSFCLAFAIGAAIIAVFFGVASATRMRALLGGFHAISVAL
jgi:hypothetical protein